MKSNATSLVVIAAGLIMFACLALAGVLMIQPGPESTQRLGLFFGVVGTSVAAFVGLLKAGEAATNTNGSLDQRIEDGVHRALAGRRTTDAPLRSEVGPEPVDTIR